MINNTAHADALQYTYFLEHLCCFLLISTFQLPLAYLEKDFDIWQWNATGDRGNKYNTHKSC